jgi:hypothetical protein
MRDRDKRQLGPGIRYREGGYFLSRGLYMCEQTSRDKPRCEETQG